MRSGKRAGQWRECVAHGGWLQVYPGGVRLIRPDGRHIDWKPPGTHTVTHAAVNGRQVAIALSATEVVYFELDAAGQLNEHSDRFNPGVCSAPYISFASDNVSSTS
jgi:hypothetical protein